MLKNLNKIFISATAIFAISFGNSYAKLPIQYDNFTINGKTQRLAIAEVEINGTPINKSTAGVDPVTINSRTLVPVRALSEKLGYKVSWLDAAQKVKIESNDKKIELVIGSKIAYINDRPTAITDAVPARIINSSTYVPIRFVTENLGLNISYNAKLNKTTLNSLDSTSVAKSNSIDNLLFNSTDQTILNNETNNSPSNPTAHSPILDNIPTSSTQSPANPWEPVDVEQFTSTTNSNNANTPVISKPTAPTVPTVPKVEKVKIPEVKNTTTDSSSSTKNNTPSATKPENITIYLLNIATSDGSDKIELSSSGEMNYEYYYLSDPKRLVIKAKYAKLKPEDEQEFSKRNRLINSKYFDFLSVSQSEQTVTLNLFIKKDVNTDNLNITTTKNTLSVNEKAGVTSNNGNVSNKSFSFNIDRKTGTININSKNVKADTSSSNRIKLKIPKSDLTLSTGYMNVSGSVVKSAYVEQDATNYVVTIELNDRVTYNVSKTSSSTIISLNKVARTTPIIVLDAGHGGKDAGAVNSTLGLREKDLNLQMILKLGAKLSQRGYNVQYTRTEDNFLELMEIPRIGNSYDPDIFISIHQNSAKTSTPYGLETYYYKPSNDSQPLAKSIHTKLISQSGAFDRGVRTAPFVVIKHSSSPAILIEVGFISNYAEAPKLATDSYQEILTNAIADGVDNYFNR
ncbi:N-acetylmuramoyl-L-alanine amidase [Criibacterium bergeronii]|uniref:N-acetylmuramoyl-L-alanine amidase n=1 Tax=Criibacterium bergeronii TaxID=1871336 RepID=A0A371IMU7_9FIRM|nr:N-acetylmuramoyl-L-alanine amidase [Criibacterium bergeronii]MBS6063074.1 N-acetylmuramoyl-L-alanine amidase [Peptostreptococcaceae bacterium]RDY21815.1 N-acetylmuramoyl-L-alanine amidase [Criibacterium bergeronii]